MDSFIAWVGGKKLLRKEIVNRFPENVEKYVEVFGGAGWVLFHKDNHGKKEVYNDINSDLVNLFRCFKYHPEAMEKEMQFVLNARDTFFHYHSQMKSGGLTDIQRAAKYLHIIRASYGAKVSTFGLKNRDVTDLSRMQEIQKRLSKVLIENKSFDKLIMAHDSQSTLFYCARRIIKRKNIMIQVISFLMNHSMRNYGIYLQISKESLFFPIMMMLIFVNCIRGFTSKKWCGQIICQ